MNLILFLHIIISFELWRIYTANKCPLKNCVCGSSNSWNCKITDDQDQIDCNQQTIDSRIISVNLELITSSFERQPLFINTERCNIKILKLTSNIIPWNKLIGNINSLEFLIINNNQKNSLMNFENYINNFLFGINQLTRLKIENINLQHWSIQNLETCGNVKEIEFKNLQMKIVDIDSFINCKNLTKLTIRFNKMLKIFIDSFKGLTELVYLSLSSNQCEELISNGEGWWILKSLLKLDLSNNALSKLGMKMFIGLSKLERLILNDNPIEFIDRSAFEGLIKLKSLNLQGNFKLKLFDLLSLSPMRTTLTDLFINSDVIHCIDMKSELNKFHFNVQKELRTPQDCHISNFKITRKHFLSTKSNTIVEDPKSYNMTLIIIVAVLITILIVAVFVIIFIYCTSRKKIRKYKNSGSDRSTNQSNSLRNYDFHINNHTIENHRPFHPTWQKLQKYNSSPILGNSDINVN